MNRACISFITTVEECAFGMYLMVQEKQPSRAALREGGRKGGRTLEEVGNHMPRIPNALHSLSPLTFLKGKFNTNTNKERAEALLY